MCGVGPRGEGTPMKTKEDLRREVVRVSEKVGQIRSYL